MELKHIYTTLLKYSTSLEIMKTGGLGILVMNDEGRRIHYHDR
jgi:hypothetical protein